MLSANWIGLISSPMQFSFSLSFVCLFVFSLLNSQGSLTGCQEISRVMGMDVNGLTWDLVTCPCVSASKPFYHGTLQRLLLTGGADFPRPWLWIWPWEFLVQKDVSRFMTQTEEKCSLSYVSATALKWRTRACFLALEGGLGTPGAESPHAEFTPEQVTPADHRLMTKPCPNQPSPD